MLLNNSWLLKLPLKKMSKLFICAAVFLFATNGFAITNDSTLLEPNSNVPQSRQEMVWTTAGDINPYWYAICSMINPRAIVTGSIQIVEPTKSNFIYTNQILKVYLYVQGYNTTTPTGYMTSPSFNGVTFVSFCM